MPSIAHRYAHRRAHRPVRRLAGAIVLACALALAPTPPAAAAKNEREAKAELARIQARIKRVTESVQDDVAKRDRVAAQLRDADRSIAGARSRLDAVRKSRLEREQRRAGLRAEQARTEQALAAERDELGAQLRSAYMSGRQEQLRVLLNAQDPATLGRLLTYYSYLGRARAAKIATIREQVTRLETLDQELAVEEAKLAELEQQRASEVAALDGARTRRERALGELKQRIASRTEELGTLRSNAQALESLLARLREAIEEFDAADVTDPTGGRGRAFQQVRGKLPWPARGRIAANYGDARPGGLRWNGVLLETSPGAQVRAPYYGRVVYADWLTGLGLLLILDHGGGYLSLYAHNQKIYRAVGDRVSPGDVLAASGDVAGRPELYFEIRRGSKPVDPRPWLKGSPAR